jgi:hypothetical protein
MSHERKQYQPSGRACPTREELRNGFDEWSLTAHLKETLGSEYELRCELLLRARDRERQCGEAVAQFKRTENLTGDTAKQSLRALETELANAKADTAFAVARLAVIEAAA